VSTQPSHSTEHLPPPPAQAQEAIHWPKVLGTGVGFLIIATISVIITTKMMNAREKVLQPIGPDPMPLQIGSSEIGIVDQAPFDVSRAAQNYRDDRLQRLSSWGWVDRKNGVVHMPIEEAMQQVVKEQHK